MPAYRGLNVNIPENDAPHREYLQQCGTGQLSLQKCQDCGFMRYPPGPMCPECQSLNLGWAAVSGKGTIHSYYIVPHAINPAFRDWTPYPVILVELDEQRGVPTEHRAIRMVGNLVAADGSAETEANIAIGKRVQVTMVDLGDGMALPQWHLSAEPPEETPWQFPANA